MSAAAGRFEGLTEPVRVGVCGLGFMGRTHLSALARARQDGAQNVIAAVADRNAHRRAGQLDAGGNLETTSGDAELFDPLAVEAFSDPFELVARAQVDLVTIATPTDTHVPLALAALEAGLHVLLEKPVALRSSEVRRLRDAAASSDRVCMPAMCIRFWPGWEDLQRTIAEGTHGRLKTLAIRRLASRPDWNPGFYSDPKRTGGALFDLHVHDVDFVRFCLGEPQGVQVCGHLDHVFASYDFGADGPDAVVVEGGWDHAPGYPFQMGYTAVFEGATQDYDVRREDPLLEFGAEGERVVPLDSRNGYELEVAHLLSSLAAGERPRVDLDEALKTTELLEREREQL